MRGNIECQLKIERLTSGKEKGNDFFWALKVFVFTDYCLRYICT